MYIRFGKRKAINDSQENINCSVLSFKAHNFIFIGPIGMLLKKGVFLFGWLVYVNTIFIKEKLSP